ncbi:MAG: NAD(P)H-hydrate dehydratase [Niabella sp.]
MKLLNAAQIRQWDQYTIEYEPVSSIQLMERASKACTRWILQNMLANQFYIFCGKGNNGGDGLAIARLLKQAGKQCRVYVIQPELKGSDDFNANFEHLHQQRDVPITLLKSETEYPAVPQEAIIIDALFGTGLNRPLDGNIAALVKHINLCSSPVISIDIPSGMLSDESRANNTVIKATHTLTFQCLKLAFLLPENEPFIGQIHILDINLHPDYIETIDSNFQLINKAVCKSILKPRKLFAHKGNYGHALMMAGSYGKMGAAVLSTKACLTSGAGLVTAHVPECGVTILQTSVPEAMCSIDEHQHCLSHLPEDMKKYTSIGVGPGLGNSTETVQFIEKLIKQSTHPLVLDADALNIIAGHQSLLEHLPAGSILTPHPKEFERLFGGGLNDFQKIELAVKKSKELNIIVVLKGHHTFIATPNAGLWFNITGNPGMATGGSGDVLTGLITGLLAQGYTSAEAAITSVFLHGLSGDLAADTHSMEAMIASNIIEMMGKAFMAVNE